MGQIGAWELPVCDPVLKGVNLGVEDAGVDIKINLPKFKIILTIIYYNCNFNYYLL